ncbi:MAG: metallophosphoesterase family protein [Cytophagales bacterium]|nr:metallophosphoesterase family protein [Rhizobacter sp.]
MKLALVTDLHANREAVEAVLAHAQSQGAERHAFLGDFVGYGADPGWVVDCVREHVAQGAVAIKGNHDAAAVMGPQPSMVDDARAVVAWTHEQLSADQIDFLATLPLTAVDETRLFVHANAFAPPDWAYIHARSDAVRSMHATACRITFCGHVHEPRLYHLASTGKVGEFAPVPDVPIPLSPQRKWLVIPGSAGQPRDHNPAACYAMFDIDSGDLTFHRVPYDHDTAAAKVRAAGLPLRLAQRLQDGG